MLAAFSFVPRSLPFHSVDKPSTNVDSTSRGLLCLHFHILFSCACVRLVCLQSALPCTGSIHGFYMCAFFLILFAAFVPSVYVSTNLVVVSLLMCACDV